MIYYLTEFSIILSLFGILQFVLIRKIADYKTQRHFILGGLISSLIIPLLPAILFTQIDVFSVLLPEVLVTTDGAAITETIIAQSNSSAVWIGVSMISLALLLRCFFGLFKIMQIVWNGEKKTIAKESVIITEKSISPCSFFSYIILPKSIELEEDEIKLVIAHEKMHIEFLHSADKIVLALTKAIFWWHPVLWFYNRELNLVHEYQVDEAITQTHNKQRYSQVLLQLVIHPPTLNMVNPISSNIKKRIMKMNYKRTHRPVMIGLALSALITSCIFIHSCTTDDTTKEETVGLIKKENDEIKSYIQISLDTIVSFDMETKKEIVRYVTTESEIFKGAEEMPQFPGCDTDLNTEELNSCSQQKLLEYIYTNISYPQEARDAGIEGMIVTRFIVSKDGTIYNFTFPKTLGNGLENSVRTMLNKMQSEILWVPGKQNGKAVNVEYTLPVKFKLES